MLNQWFDLVYNYLQLGHEVEKYDEGHFHLPNGRFLEHQGLRTHYLEEGEGRHTIIFLHGIMMNSNIWDSYLHRFSKCGQVYALDFLGHGLSSKKPDLALNDLVTQLDHFIRLKKLKKPILIGHSLGGMIASIYAAKHPDQVSQIITISSVDYDSFVSDLFTQVNSSLISFLEGLLNPLTSLLFMDTLMNRVYNNENFIQYHERDHFLYHIKIRGFKDSAFSLMKNYRLQGFSSREYENITCPALVIHGDKDKLIDYENSKRLREVIPQARLELVPGGSHMLIHEDEERVMSLLEEALELKKASCLRK